MWILLFFTFVIVDLFAKSQKEIPVISTQGNSFQTTRSLGAFYKRHKGFELVTSAQDQMSQVVVLSNLDKSLIYEKLPRTRSPIADAVVFSTNKSIPEVIPDSKIVYTITNEDLEYIKECEINPMTLKMAFITQDRFEEIPLNYSEGTLQYTVTVPSGLDTPMYLVLTSDSSKYFYGCGDHAFGFVENDLVNFTVEGISFPFRLLVRTPEVRGVAGRGIDLPIDPNINGITYLGVNNYLNQNNVDLQNVKDLDTSYELSISKLVEENIIEEDNLNLSGKKVHYIYSKKEDVEYRYWVIENNIDYHDYDQNHFIVFRLESTSDLSKEDLLRITDEIKYAISNLKLIDPK